ncbi:non-canonical purine NTP pyrophosphatase [Limimaricola cinnabarinus]|jgi:XTP/dITP diphosphohydrolase|uniref:dITP/XTP pyrophosphatase n=1 Tax=Limimaricola cinnabarinus TaxID=1125964 RepID=A0A2G1MHT8_9RHOB|nr:non-canonical purine NTP pyrophosphatase [Limimaricola cinnabarinus]PHP28319.1 non-canonical purine NTP pyrophosphatase [Limimaricola cinnabarinus]
MRRFTETSLVVATHNAGKLDEFRALLSPFGVTVTGNADHGLPEPEETETTFVGNARIKARAAVAATGLPALADDSGLEVFDLGGRPGVHTADWAETGEGRDFDIAMKRVHDELLASGAPAPHRARFCCTLVLAWPDGHEEIFEGHAGGEVIWPMRGARGHGYDPIFVPEGHDVTFAQMDADTKNAMSHRARAVEKLRGCFG